jgi:hypothetical protein
MCCLCHRELTDTVVSVLLKLAYLRLKPKFPVSFRVLHDLTLLIWVSLHALHPLHMLRLQWPLWRWHTAPTMWSWQEWSSLPAMLTSYSAPPSQVPLFALFCQTHPRGLRVDTVPVARPDDWMVQPWGYEVTIAVLFACISVRSLKHTK